MINNLDQMVIYGVGIFLCLCIGSFLNVCIWRLPRNVSVSKPRRSYCPRCGRQLKSWENVPVLSWLILLGRCFSCGQPISIRYPLVELSSVGIGYYCWLNFGSTPTGLLVYFLCCTLLVITLIDLDFRIIPDRITFPGIAIGLLLGLVAEFYPVFETPITSSFMDSLLGIAFGGGVFYSIEAIYLRMTGRSGLGMGDVKLMAMFGAIMGYQCIMTTAFVGSFAGSVVGLVAITLGKRGRFYEIPFGPWLAIGALSHIFSWVTLFKIP